MIAIVTNIYKIFQLFKEFIVISILRNEYRYSTILVSYDYNSNVSQSYDNYCL